MTLAWTARTKQELFSGKLGLNILLSGLELSKAILSLVRRRWRRELNFIMYPFSFLFLILLLSYCLKVCDTITYFWKKLTESKTFTHFSEIGNFCSIYKPTSITLLENLFIKVNFTSKHNKMCKYLFVKLSYLGTPHLGLNFQTGILFFLREVFKK